MSVYGENPAHVCLNNKALILNVITLIDCYSLYFCFGKKPLYNSIFLRNLLGDNPSEKLDIKMCPDGSGQLYVPGLTEFTVESVEDINKVRAVLMVFRFHFEVNSDLLNVFISVLCFEF